MLPDLDGATKVREEAAGGILVSFLRTTSGNRPCSLLLATR